MMLNRFLQPFCRLGVHYQEGMATPRSMTISSFSEGKLAF
jgi:hypothetical protein